MNCKNSGFQLSLMNAQTLSTRLLIVRGILENSKIIQVVALDLELLSVINI